MNTNMTDTDHTSTDHLTNQLPLDPGRWTLDDAHSSVGFSIRHLGISKVRGTVAEVDATLTVGATLDETAVSATIALGSIDTGNAVRDAHVCSPELLDTERRPTLSFASTAIRGRTDMWIVDGELTIGDVTKPVVLDVELGGIETFPLDQRPHAGFEARTEIRRSEFGLLFGALDGLLGDVVKVELDLQFALADDA